MILVIYMIAVKVIHLLIILITTFKEIIVLATKKSRGETARQFEKMERRDRLSCKLGVVGVL